MAKLTKITFGEFDVESLKAATVEALYAGLNGLIEGAAEDLQTFAVEIAADMIEAAALGRSDLIDELVGQLEVLAETNRVRTAVASRAAARAVIASLGAFLIKAIVPVPA